ncbi:RNA-guided endonuclease InsQ/TnpB family protein [Nocardia grenadensis]|uniref:RNA-guided endonuclease InsQ/TnpB family protein n=1 Tax=Nocardia grenadensis TaxID=931537 RepID=UPI0007A4F843|nr:RNA-guided endonuclease TnpB family protein [Nocardia grenadensis]
MVYNDGLRIRQRAHVADRPYITDSALQTRVITEAKKTPERTWPAEVSTVAPVQALGDLHTAYRNFFASVPGRRKGAKLTPPRFRSRRDNRQAIRFTRNGFSLRSNRRLYVAEVDELALRWSRELPSDPSSVTIVKDASGRYFASFVVQTDDSPLPPVQAEVGIDLGLSTFAVLSDGKTIASPRFLRQAERRLRKAQQDLSRKEKGSKSRAKARTRLAKSVHDAGWGMFTRMLEEKAHRNGRTFGKVDRFFPSTRMCSVCGAMGGKKPLHVRVWTCACGAVPDRDVNAAIIILAAGRAERLNACGGTVSPAA